MFTGYPGCEYQIREALASTIGPEKSELFFDKVLIFLESITTRGSNGN